MRAYIIRRLLLIIPTLLIVSAIVFGIIRLIPGSAIDIMMSRMDVGTGKQEEQRAAIRHELGLDIPIHVQYGQWMKNIIMHGDLGDRLWERTPVADELLKRFPVSLELGLLALLTALIISFPIGIYSGVRQDNVGDYVGRSFAILCIAVPGFWLGTMVMVFPSIWWGWSPPIMLVSFVEDPIENLAQFIIPAIIMGMSLSGVNMRMVRTMMLEVMRQDYIRTAWSKGLREKTVILRHALKNALIPVVTLIGLQVPIVVGGAVIMEQIFCLPGWGRLVVESAIDRDYPTLSGVALAIAGFVLLINLAVDLTYAILDPRIKYG